MLKIAIITGSPRPGRKGEAVARWIYDIAAKRSDASFEVVDIAAFDSTQLTTQGEHHVAAYCPSQTQRKGLADSRYPITVSSRSSTYSRRCGVTNFDRQTVINNNLVLSKAARVFDVPVVLSTVETKGFSGNMWPQIKAVFPKQAPIERSTMNCWDDANFVATIAKSGRKKIVLAGLWTETCVARARCLKYGLRSPDRTKD